MNRIRRGRSAIKESKLAQDAPAQRAPGLLPGLLRASADYIESVQGAGGEIAWFDGGAVDPWDHVEAAMGLSIAGYWLQAERAYDWLARLQLPDGGWWAAYEGEQIIDASRRESNFVAYIATGVWHHYRVTSNTAFLARLWPAVEAALDSVCALQREHGEIPWAVDAAGRAAAEALLTGCSSIYKSLECGLNMAAALHRHKPGWRLARARLGEALRRHPERFDQSKRRYSMDWFYPVLCGAVTGGGARTRLAARWREFVVPGLGCRCVSDRHWVTVAESCELVIALVAAGQRGLAHRLFGWLHELQDENGVYWTGYAFAEEVLWPLERPTWTAGVALLAADALYGLTPAAGVFTSGAHTPGEPQAAHPA